MDEGERIKIRNSVRKWVAWSLTQNEMPIQILHYAVVTHEGHSLIRRVIVDLYDNSINTISDILIPKWIENLHDIKFLGGVFDKYDIDYYEIQSRKLGYYGYKIENEMIYIYG